MNINSESVCRSKKDCIADIIQLSNLLTGNNHTIIPHLIERKNLYLGLEAFSDKSNAYALKICIGSLSEPIERFIDRLFSLFSNVFNDSITVHSKEELMQWKEDNHTILSRTRENIIHYLIDYYNGNIPQPQSLKLYSVIHTCPVCQMKVKTQQHEYNYLVNYVLCAQCNVLMFESSK